MYLNGLEINVKNHPLIATCHHHSLKHLLYFFLQPYDFFRFDGDSIAIGSVDGDIE